MWKTLSIVLFFISSLPVFPQSYDERIAGAMNSSDWFALDSIYNAAPKDSIMPFLEVFSRCLTGNRLNRPDISLPAFSQLFNEHSTSLDLNNLLSSTIMYTTDLGRTGYHGQAAELAKSVQEATRQYLDPTWTEALEDCISKHKALSAYRPYDITFDSETGHIPFSIIPVGEEKHGSVLMHLDNSTINGHSADITFDTGAGVNLISDSLAKEFNLTPLDAYVTVAGVGKRKGRFAIAKEIRIGDITVSDVPFVIMDFTTGNAKADRFTDCFNIVIGSELMLQLKDLTVDFINREISIPSVTPERSSATPNMCFGQGMTLNVAGSIAGSPILMNIDTGDASYGTLDVSFFNENRKFIESSAESDTVRRAGIGGVVESLCYRLPAIPINLGGRTMDVAGLVVNTTESSAAMDFACNIGIKTLMSFGKVRFNMVDFMMTTTPQKTAVFNSPAYNTPVLKFTKEKGPSALETTGFIAVEVLKALIDTNVIR